MIFNKLLLLSDLVFEGEYPYEDKKTGKFPDNSEMVKIMQNILEHLEDRTLRSLVSLFFLLDLTDEELMKKFNISPIRLEMWRYYIIFRLQILCSPLVRYIWR